MWALSLLTTLIRRSSRWVRLLLAITGAEALYADMGHFGGRRSGVPGSWVVFPG